ncbi:MAG: GTPase [Gammaproteobacteria bacterium]
MPTNVSPEYKKAEAAFRKARDPRERLDCLRQMLRTIPKHKGTEHLQGDIKSRIKQLSDELAGPRKGGKRGAQSHSVRREGAAQVAMLGPPNSGKSALHNRLTGARSEIGAYPFTTRQAQPGMLAWEDVHFQILDLPSIGADFTAPWLPTALQTADAAMLVVDLSDPACTEQLAYVLEWLDGHKIGLTAAWPGGGARPEPAASQQEDPFRIELPGLMLANKRDLDPGPGEIEVLEDLLDLSLPAIGTSAETGHGLDRIGSFLFEHLDVVRVYTKTPGKAPDMHKPFTVFGGDSVTDVAARVHQDMAASLRFARIWGASVYDGQQVGPEHRVEDGDIVVLHMD